MIIKQKRVRKLPKLKSVKDGTIIRVAKEISEEHSVILSELGFSEYFSIGETILPGIIGPATRKNAVGDIIIHRDKEKEKHSRMIEWTYKQWAGKGETKEVTDSTSITYTRYPRTLISPISIEFTIVEKNGAKIITSPEYKLSKDNEVAIVTAINVLLEAFGECEILDSNNDSIIQPKVIKLNWEVLPKGKYPWDAQKQRLEPFLKRATGKNQQVVEKRLEEINKFSPDFTAVGTGGFTGYLVYGFESKELFILESIQVNNATYILKSDWENIAQLTKSEILNNDLHEARVIHNKQWYSSIARLLA